MLSIKEISVIDDSLLDLDFSKLHLSLQVSMNRFSYAIIHKDFRKYLLFESYFLDTALGDIFDENICKENLRNIYNREVILKEKFFSVSYSFIDKDFVLFPQELFDIEKKDCYLSILTDRERDSNNYNFRNMDNISIGYLYYSYKEINVFLEGIYGKDIKFYHASEIFIKKVLDSKDTGVFINFMSDNIFEVFIKRRHEELDFYNQYNFDTEQESFYIIHSLLLEYEIPYKVNVFLYGNIYEDSDIYRYLISNIRNIIIPTFEKDYLYSVQFANLPYHRFYTLFGQYE